MRKLVAMGAGLLALTSLTGCGSDVPDDGYLIKVWGTFNDTYGAIVDKAIKKMKELHPEYTIRYTKQTGMGYNELADAVTKGFAAGDYPDAVVAYPDNVANFIMAGKALDVKPYMQDEEIGWDSEDMADIPEAYIEEGESYFRKGMFSVPLCKSTEAMYYNRDVLINLNLSDIDDEINSSQPLDDNYLQHLTWEELFGKLCPALVKYDQTVEKILTPTSEYEEKWAIVGYDSDDNFFITLAEQYGLPYTSLNPTTKLGSVDFCVKEGENVTVNEGYMDLMKMLANAYQNKYLTTKGIIAKNVNYVSTGGGMLFSIGSTGGVSYQFSSTSKFDVGVAPVPQRAKTGTTEWDEDNIKLINQGPSLAFLKRGEGDVRDLRARGAWMFYDIWSSVEINSEWSQTSGYTPIRNSVTMEPSYLAYKDTTSKELHTLDMLTARNAQYVAGTLDYLYSSPVFYGSSKARTAVAAIIADILKGSVNGTTKMDVESAAFRTLVKNIFGKAYDNAI